MNAWLTATFSQRWLRSLAALACVVSYVCWPAVSLSKSLAPTVFELEQPEVQSRVLAADLLLDLYVGPEGTTHLDEQELRSVALQEYRQAFGHDGRTEFSSVRTELLPEIARLEEREADRLLVRELELGRQLYRLGDLHEAVRVLEAGLESIGSSPIRWSRIELLAESLETMALSYQELAAGVDAPVMQLETQTRLSLRELIRFRPHAVVDARRYPLSFVEAWRQAYFEQLAVSAAVLALRIEEARQATALLDVDVLADLRLMTGPRGSSIALRVYDAVSDRFAYDGILSWDGSAEHLGSQLSRAFSVARDCMSILPPPKKEGRQRLMYNNFMSMDGLGFVYLDRPTNKAFMNVGFRIGGHHYVTPVVGFFADIQAAFSSRDPDGVLLSPIQLQALSAGLTLQYRRDRFRLHMDVGLLAARRSEIVATDSFWCRVSGGADSQFGAGRSCDAGDVFRQRSSGLFGLQFRGGLGVRLVGPIWLQTAIIAHVYGIPFGHRGVDRPVGAQVGFAYEY